MTVLNLSRCWDVSGDLASVAGLTHLTELYLYRCRGVSGDLASVAGLTHLTVLILYRTSVTAPDGCPKDKVGDLYYPDAAACGELIAWLNDPANKPSIQELNSPMRSCCCVLS